MEEKNEKNIGNQEPREDFSYKITFKRLNKLTILVGIVYIVLAIINIPWLYNDTYGQIMFGFSEKPTILLGANITAYVFLGITPIIIGIAFISFSIITSREISLTILENGECQYFKKGVPILQSNFLTKFDLLSNLHQIKLGNRHQRFVIWVPVAINLFIILILYDYINFLNLNYDIAIPLYELSYSLKLNLIFNIVYMIAILIPFTFFPRKLCRIDCTGEYIQFDYEYLILQKKYEYKEVPFYLKPFDILTVGNDAPIPLPKEKLELKSDLPEVLKSQITSKEFCHIPIFQLALCLCVFVLILLSYLLPNYFLGGFTLRIEYFMLIGVFYLIVRTLQNNWYSKQEISSSDGSSNLLIKRTNRLFGESIIYFGNIEKISQEFAPRKPHFLEYGLFFFPLLEIIWTIVNISSNSLYFFTMDPYTVIYIIVIVCIFLLMVSEYIFPLPLITSYPKKQVERGKTNQYSIYFPENRSLKFPLIKETFQSDNFIEKYLAGILLILIPLIIGTLWVVLSSIGIIPSIYSTIF